MGAFPFSRILKASQYMERISCIIPAYNEEKGLAAVLSAVSNHPLLDEVIVVDDGSSDRTAEIAQSFPDVRLLVNDQNRGKTATICRGIEECAHPYVLLLDADLTGLTETDISRLIEPVRAGSASASISLRNYYSWRLFGIDPLSGDRLLPKTLLLERLEELRALPAFALEVYINALLIEGQFTFTVVPWLGVHSPLKAAKYGLITGVRDEVRMWKDIGSYVQMPELLRQFWNLRRLARQHQEALLNRLFLEY